MIRVLAGRSPSAGGSGGGAPIITGVSGSTAHGGELIVSGANFLTHADYGGTQPFLCKAWWPFATSLEGGNWVQDGFDPENCILSTSSPMGGACGQFYRKQHVTANQGSMEVVHGSNYTGRYFNHYHYRESDNSPVIGAGACTKSWRRYPGPNQSGINWFLGPSFENFTSYITPPASLNRWTQYPTAPYFPQATWRCQEIDEYLGADSGSLGNGTTLWGSPDFFRVVLDGAELIRRGSGLPNNPRPEQGTDANDNHQWVGVPPEGQEGGVTKLGSHLCETTAGYFLDFAEAYLDYTQARAFVDPSPTFAGVTRPHMQPPYGWSDEQLTLLVNRGRHASIVGLYLYVVNENGLFNAAGFLIP